MDDLQSCGFPSLTVYNLGWMGEGDGIEGNCPPS